MDYDCNYYRYDAEDAAAFDDADAAKDKDENKDDGFHDSQVKTKMNIMPVTMFINTNNNDDSNDDGYKCDDETSLKQIYVGPDL